MRATIQASWTERVASRTRLTWSFATDIKPNSNGPPCNGQDPGADREPAGQIESQLSQSTASPGACPLRGGPLELGLMSVAKLQVSLVRLVRSTMLESLPACLFMDFCELTKPDSSSQSQIGTPLTTTLNTLKTDFFLLRLDPTHKSHVHVFWCNPPVQLARNGPVLQRSDV